MGKFWVFYVHNAILLYKIIDAWIEGTVNSLVSRATLRRVLGKLKGWAVTDHMKFLIRANARSYTWDGETLNACTAWSTRGWRGALWKVFWEFWFTASWIWVSSKPWQPKKNNCILPALSAGRGNCLLWCLTPSMVCRFGDHNMRRTWNY